MFSWDDNPDLNITPLVDVMLVLMAILMVTAPTITYQEQIDLPQGSKTIHTTKAKSLTIRMDKNSIEIEDNGGGVDEAIMEKIFEPYFTTKFQSLGTGIGLYMSKIIITKHFNSELEVYNSKSGAVFKIALF